MIKNVEEYFNNKVESLSLSKDPEHVSGTSGLSVREALIMWLRQKKITIFDYEVVEYTEKLITESPSEPSSYGTSERMLNKPNERKQLQFCIFYFYILIF